MAKQTINIGASPNDGTGTPLRTAFDYTNQNFTELYTAVGPSGNNIVCPGSATITGDLTVRTNKLKVDSNGVGIGTASPSIGTLSITSYFLFFTDSQSKFGDNGLINGAASDGNTQIQFFGGKSLFFNEGLSTRMTLNSTGLGVGVTPTVAKVQTNGAFATNGSLVNLAGNPLANALLLDFNATCRQLATGPNTTTAGVHKFINASSDASVFLETLTLDALGNVIIRSPATPATLTTNGQLTVNATSNTNLRFSYRGSDGTTRVANITLA